MIRPGETFEKYYSFEEFYGELPTGEYSSEFRIFNASLRKCHRPSSLIILQVGCSYKFPMTSLNALIDSKNKIIEKLLDKYGLLL